MAELKKDDKIITTKDVKADIAEQSKKNRENGGKDVVVSILDTVDVVFTKDFGFMRKNQKARISTLAYETYKRNKCVEKTN